MTHTRFMVAKEASLGVMLLVTVAALLVPLIGAEDAIWKQTTWVGGRKTPTLQVGTWDSSYDNDYTGENENENAAGELRLALSDNYENGMKMLE